MDKLFYAIVPFLILTSTQSAAFDDDAIKAQCDAEWGTDFAIVKYCRDQQRAAGNEYDRFKEEAQASQTMEIILTRCEGEWAKNYSMVVYCSKQQLAALESLGTSPQDVPENVNEAIRSTCASEWNTDFAMVAYCVQQQTSSWRSLQ